MPAVAAALPRNRVTLRDVRPEKLTAELARVTKLLKGKPPFTPVGFDNADGVVWLIDHAGFLRGIPIRQLRRSMLISLCGLDWLLSQFPKRWEKTGEKTGHFDVDKAAAAVISACQAMGYFAAARLRITPPLSRGI
jgi:hypothetical protein